MVYNTVIIKNDIVRSDYLDNLMKKGEKLVYNSFFLITLEGDYNIV